MPKEYLSLNNAVSDETVPDEELCDVINQENTREKLKTASFFIQKNWDEIISSNALNPEAKAMLSQERCKISEESLKKLNNWDQRTFRHSISITNLASLVIKNYAEKWELNEDDVITLFNVATTHDLGKTRISRNILNKRGKLDEKEMTEMQKHPIFSAEQLNEKEEQSLADIVIMHHNNQGENSYPSKDEIENVLPGHASRLTQNPKIEEFAKIVSIIDKVDAMLTDSRSYKNEMWPDDAKRKLKETFPGQKDLIDFIIDNWREVTV